MKPATVDLHWAAPQVMAIVNVTPDSFYAGSRTRTPETIERRILEAVGEGATILDVGGYSSRPGAAEVPVEEEWARVKAGVGAARRLAPDAVVSVDTFRSEVARRVLDAFGPVIINDISAGELDPQMLDVVARYEVPYIAMHMKGDPQTMQSLTEYRRDITTEVVSYFRERVERFLAAGIRRERIILDPGFGFAKTVDQNYELLSGLHRLCELGFPVLAGLFRQSVRFKAPATRPRGVLARHGRRGWECLRQGARILRVHDVREAADTVRLFRIYEQNKH